VRSREPTGQAQHRIAIAEMIAAREHRLHDVQRLADARVDTIDAVEGAIYRRAIAMPEMNRSG
jgi:hypothetical protein